ncbi:SMC-Scp complex subunit ScpB [candidate division KSB1 bacterium]|nr:SMC-Scp complex subunit ScpB [candidate division KSB1 bacterium]NIR72819.1 SMC-Scp complex subunit ScpB [candidate division KSB1 bacterium]NIS26859.1 SMC-Scp complex subunit ScpB [candidate division KSB1 bacterium]NIT73655.1 SMC-Scp complex subunit ScpB [candidate division KSB1 bacterium]NIU27526.1 SMC-Scp complex subunit ScpB [candidate division KSB1 bacterium]
MDSDFQKQIVEAIIFASDEPISEKKISNYVEALTPTRIKEIVEEINSEYQSGKRAFYVSRVAGGYQITARKEFAPWIKKMFKGRSKPRLSQAALESLAIIAFRQPISRTEVDAIRGVHSGGVIKNLLERSLISIAGRSEEVGKPLLYATSKEFLRYFGINDISELPRPREIEEIMGKLEKSEEFSEQIIEALTELNNEEENEENETP